MSVEPSLVEIADASWPHIVGLHAVDDGTMAAVWLTHDTGTDVVHLYDAVRFDREILLVIADALTKRGDWKPISWHKGAESISERLYERGVNLLPDAVPSDGAVAEVVSREIEERMRTGRFKVGKHLDAWVEEFASFTRQDRKVPLDGFPLMAATRHAMTALEQAEHAPQTGAGEDRDMDHGRNATTGY